LRESAFRHASETRRPKPAGDVDPIDDVDTIGSGVDNARPTEN